nr:MAG TPA: protein of unknown function (DUF5047) [Caudoviricetes sp.]
MPPQLRSRLSAAGFSLVLTAGGTEVARFGNITVTKAVDGLGTSGICTSQLTFATPAPFNAYRAAEVVLTGVSGVGKYYIDSRSQSGGVVTVTCLDRMAFSDEDFPYASIDSSVPKNVPINTVMDLIVRTVGELTGWGGIPSWLTSISRTELQGTCSDILTKISEACCGVFYITDEQNLQFLPYGNTSGQVNADVHTALDVGCEFTAAGIKCTDGDGNVITRGDASRKYDSICISSELITDSGCEEIWGRAENYTHTAYSCQRCRLDGIPPTGGTVNFAGSGIMRAGSVTASISKAGIFAEVSNPEPSDSEIGMRGRNLRESDSKVRYGRSGTMMFTKYQGVVMVDGEETVNSG